MAGRCALYHAPYTCRIPEMYLRWNSGDTGPRQGALRPARWAAIAASPVPDAGGDREHAMPGNRDEAAGVPSVRAADRTAGTGTCLLPDAALLPGASRVHPALSRPRRVHGSYTGGTRQAAGRYIRPAGRGTASPRLRCQAGERAAPGTPEDHRRYTAGPSQVNGTWLHGSGKIRDHEELTVHPYDDPFPRRRGQHRGTRARPGRRRRRLLARPAGGRRRGVPAAGHGPAAAGPARRPPGRGPAGPAGAAG